MNLKRIQLLSVILFGLLTACTGPQGPAGPAGAQGPEGNANVKIKTLTVTPASFTALNAFVIEGTAVSGIAEINDPLFVNNSVIILSVRNPGGYNQALPLTVFDSSGNYEALNFAYNPPRIYLYYQRFTKSSNTYSYKPASNLTVTATVIQGTQAASLRRSGIDLSDSGAVEKYLKGQGFSLE